MKKCVVCSKELEKDLEDVCETCKSFFQWKYEEKFEERIREFKEYAEEKKKTKIKFRRKKIQLKRFFQNF